MRASFSDLTSDQQARFGNGVGAYWMPNFVRCVITKGASWFFREACWRHHDFGYVVGGDRWDRARCDWKFFRAMLRDAVSQNQSTEYPFGALAANSIAIPLALMISVIFYAAVRIGGQLGSFKYRRHPATIEEVLAELD